MAVVLLVEIRFFFFTDDKKVTGNRTNLTSYSRTLKTSSQWDVDGCLDVGVYIDAFRTWA